MIKVCNQCKKDFDADEEWKKLCYSCWSSNREKSRIAELEKEVSRWKKIANKSFNLSSDDDSRIIDLGEANSSVAISKLATANADESTSE